MRFTTGGRAIARRYVVSAGQASWLRPSINTMPRVLLGAEDDCATAGMAVDLMLVCVASTRRQRAADVPTPVQVVPDR